MIKLLTNVVIILSSSLIVSSCSSLPKKSGFVGTDRYVQVNHYHGQCPKNPTLEMQKETLFFFSGELTPCCMYQSEPYMYHLYYGFFRKKLAETLRPLIEEGKLIHVSHDKKKNRCTLAFEIKGKNINQTLMGIRVTKEDHDLLIKKFLEKNKQKR